MKTLGIVLAVLLLWQLALYLVVSFLAWSFAWPMLLGEGLLWFDRLLALVLWVTVSFPSLFMADSLSEI